jgi:hypothetical protein
MRSRKHPLNGAIYTVGDDGLVYVDKQGVKGVFTPGGKYISGELTTADMHLCGWLAGPQLPPERDIPAKDMPVERVPEFAHD